MVSAVVSVEAVSDGASVVDSTAGVVGTASVALAFETFTHFSWTFVAGSDVVAASTILSSSSSVVTLSSVSASAPLEPLSVSELEASLDSTGLDSDSEAFSFSDVVEDDGDDDEVSFVDFSSDFDFEEDFSLVLDDVDFLFSAFSLSVFSFS